MAIIYKEEFQNSTGVTALLTNFPTVITEACLSPATKAAWFAAAGANGENVRVYLDAACTIRMPVDLVSWNSIAQTFEIHTLYSSLGVILNKLYLAVDDAQLAQPLVTDLYGRNAVHANASAKYHFNETSGTLADVTGHGNTLTKQGPGVATYNGADLGINFDGNVWFDASDSVNFDFSARIYSVSTVIDLTSSTNWEGLIGKGTSAGNTDWSLLQKYSAGPNISAWHTGSAATIVGGWTPIEAIGKVYVDFTSDGTTDRLYINGALFGTAIGTALVGNTTAPVHFGCARDGAAATAPIATYYGWDITNTATKSAGLIAATYSNKSSPGTFWVGQGGGVVGGIPFLSSLLLNREASLSLRGESLGSVDVTGDLSLLENMSAEHSLSLSKKSLVALDHSLQLILSRILAAELVSDMRAENAAAVENVQHIYAENLIPAAWSGAVQFIFSANAPVEVIAAFGSSATAASETATVFQSLGMMSIDASATIAAASLIPSEVSAEFAYTPKMITENTAIILSGHILSDEQLGDFFNQFSPTVEHIAVIHAQDLIPITWDGVSGFISGISKIFKSNKNGGASFAGRARIAVFPNNRKRN